MLLCTIFTNYTPLGPKNQYFLFTDHGTEKPRCDFKRLCTVPVRTIPYRSIDRPTIIVSERSAFYAASLRIKSFTFFPDEITYSPYPSISVSVVSFAHSYGSLKLPLVPCHHQRAVGIFKRGDCINYPYRR